MSGHTKGPWKWSDDQKGNVWGRRSLSPDVITGTVEGDISISDQDANLIEAAPDLLEALEGLLSYDRVVRPAFRSRPVGAPDSMARIDQDTLIRLEDKARAAINKALGK